MQIFTYQRLLKASRVYLTRQQGQLHATNATQEAKRVFQVFGESAALKFVTEVGYN
jgi:hypothetical protein